MKTKNKMIYPNNYARAVAFYEATMEPANAKNVARQATYDFLFSIYKTIEEKADDMGLKPVPDVYFDPWEQQKGRENDVKAIRTPFAKIDEFMEQLYSFCKLAKVTKEGLAVEAADFAPKKIFKTILTLSGVAVTGKEEITIACSRECAEGLKQLAESSVTLNPDKKENLCKSLFYFSRCVFDHEANWLAKCFDDMLDAGGEVERLCSMLAEQGFKMEILIDGRYVSLNYIKEACKKPEILKKAWADKNHYGIEISYEDLCIVPATLHLRTVRFAELLKNAENLPDTAIKLFMEKLKNCDGCRYCVQTDKSGTRPLAAIKVEEAMKCPYFPSFSLRWNEVSKVLIDQILAAIYSMDQE